MESVVLINGNRQAITKQMPKLVMLGFINDTALAHIKENTGLEFKPSASRYGYEAQPEVGTQIAALLMTYNFKTRYYDNWAHKNTLMLKSDHHVGFDVDSICYNCAKHNGIVTNGLLPADRLSC